MKQALLFVALLLVVTIVTIYGKQVRMTDVDAQYIDINNSSTTFYYLYSYGVIEFDGIHPFPAGGLWNKRLRNFYESRGANRRAIVVTANLTMYEEDSRMLTRSIVGTLVTSLMFVWACYFGSWSPFRKTKDDVGISIYYAEGLKRSLKRFFTRFEILILPVFIVAIVLFSPLHGNLYFWLSYALWLAYVALAIYFFRSYMMRLVLKTWYSQ